MAVTHINFNDTTAHGRKLRAALIKLKEGVGDLNDILGIMAPGMINGDSAVAANYTYMVSKFGFADETVAKAAFDELNSVAAKLNTDAAVTNVKAALAQVFNKFG